MCCRGELTSPNLDPKNCVIFAESEERLFSCILTAHAAKEILASPRRAGVLESRESFVLQAREKLNIVPMVLNAYWMLKSLEDNLATFHCFQCPMLCWITQVKSSKAVSKLQVSYWKSFV